MTGPLALCVYTFDSPAFQAGLGKRLTLWADLWLNNRYLGVQRRLGCNLPRTACIASLIMLAENPSCLSPAPPIVAEILLALFAVPSVSASITNRDLHPQEASRLPQEAKQLGKMRTALRTRFPHKPRTPRTVFENNCENG